MPDVILVVPCHNEAERLKLDRFTQFLEEQPDTGFVFVDDGSSDATGVILARWNRWPERVCVLTLPSNAGKAEAVRRGIIDAFGPRPTYVGYWDADLSTPLDEVAPMRQLLEERPGLDMVFGSRVQLLGRRIHRTATRHYMGRTFATTVSLMLGIPVYDTQCGAKLLRASPAVRQLFDEPFIARWIFDVEIIARLIARSGVEEGRARALEAIAEYPLRAWHDEPGTKLRRRDYVRAAADVLRIHSRYFLGRG
jgi:glycosyltransferase involved in cell wall biosynthesis